MDRFSSFKRPGRRRLLAQVVSVLFVLSGMAALQLSVPSYAAEPVWKGTVKTDETWTPTNGSGSSVVQQITTYTLDGPNSSYSSTFSRTDYDTTTACGTVIDTRSAVGAGPYEMLYLSVYAQDSGYVAALQGTDTNHYHIGTFTNQSCEFNAAQGWHITSTTNPSSELVYPPGSLSCRTLFYVPPGVQAINSTVKEDCTSPLVGSTEYTYKVKLDPCNSSVDSDGGGIGDCVEFDNGANPQNSADDIAPPDDVDGDGIPNSSDNCPNLGNQNQVDLDGDRIGDVCDSDIDGDGISNEQEAQMGTSPIKSDTDGDTQPDGADPCPVDPANTCVLQPTPPVLPAGAFSCSSLDAQRRVYTPSYAARVKLTAAPDLHLFKFSPSLVACWNGKFATWNDRAIVFNSVDSGAEEAILDLLGFDVTYNPEANYVKVNGSQAVVSANYDFVFRVTKLLDKLGIKKRIEGKVESKVASELRDWLKKHDVTGPEFGDEIRLQAWYMTREMDDAAGKLRSIMDRLHVPNKVANPIANFVEGKISDYGREFRQKIGALSRSNAFQKLSADQMANRLTKDLFAVFDPKLTMLVWRPNYIYSLSKDGAISKSNGVDHFENPFLTIKSRGE